MVFSSAIFLLMFLPIVFIGNLLIRKRYSNYFLLFASLVFYAWGEPYLVFLMLISIFLNWVTGLLLSMNWGGGLKVVILVLGVACDLGMLGYYKYAGFFAKIINLIFKRELLPVIEFALPIGISFYTFQAISYLVDVYRGDTEASKKFVNVALYISFFPQLIAGPIVKYKDINSQIENRFILWTDVSDGFKRFIYGLGKKVLIANTLGICVDTIYTSGLYVDFKAAWIGALAYTFQIYYDFSGYSDMAIGLGRMFGFKILENFDYPYLSHSITEFWRRWHISLGSWFREYVYIPLGGNRKGKCRTYLNLLLVFFLTGLWHGADLSFVVWGLFHGCFIILERVGLKRLLDKAKVFSMIYTFFRLFGGDGG